MSDNEWLKAKRNVDAALHTPTNSLAEITRLRANLAAAQEREQRMREALEGMTERYCSLVNCGDCGFWNPEEEEPVKAARAALGEPQAQGCSKWGPDFPPSCCTAWEDCVSDGMCHDPNCGAPSQHSSEDSPND